MFRSLPQRTNEAVVAAPRLPATLATYCGEAMLLVRNPCVAARAKRVCGLRQRDVLSRALLSYFR